MRFDSHQHENCIVREAIALPLRIGASATRLGLGLTEHVLRATWRLIAAAMPREGERVATDSGGPRTDVEIDTVEREPRTSAAARASTEAQPGATAPSESLPDLGRTHVSEDVEFVEAFAEPGAEEGAGAEVHIDEPWTGYAGLTANEIIARLRDASAEELAAVELYEARHRARPTVLAASEGQLRRVSAAARTRS